MKKNKLGHFITLGLMTATCCWAGASESALETAEIIKEPEILKVETPQTSHDISQVSTAFGHMIGKNLTLVGIEFDMDKVLQGIKESLEGKNTPLSEEDCIAAITKIQEVNFQKTASVNLEKANSFMEENSQKTGIVEIEKNKVQYKIEHEGKGGAVKETSTPLIKYTGKFINGQVFTSSTEEERISLQETMAGFAKGIEGMQEGEKRTIYIHPDRAYGTSGYLAPNSTLIFDIEVIKADSPDLEDLTGAGSATVDISDIPSQQEALVH